MAKRSSHKKRRSHKRRQRSAKKMGICMQRVIEKKNINMAEGRPANQAFAIAMKQIAKEYPRCRKFLNESTKAYYRKKLSKVK
jgi:hypothetical protein